MGAANASSSYQTTFYPPGVGFPYSPTPSAPNDPEQPGPMKSTAFRIPKIPAVVKLMLGAGALIIAGSITIGLANVVTLIPVVGPAFAAALAIAGLAVSVIGVIGFALGTIATTLALTTYILNKL